MRRTKGGCWAAGYFRAKMLISKLRQLSYPYTLYGVYLLILVYIAVLEGD
jgi:hypothetical protein